MLAVLSVLMLASMHAVKVTHLHHHRHCLDEEDEEARHAAWAWWKVLVAGPLLIVRLHAGAWRLARGRERWWIAGELGLVVVFVGAVCVMAGEGGEQGSGMGRLAAGLRWHCAAMLAGECMTAFFAVWIVHRGCEHDGQIARTQRGWMKNFVSYSMFYHLEHHLWPAVPTCHLPELARRLDGVEPGVGGRQVV
jgi:fatty acid desaturase